MKDNEQLIATEIRRFLACQLPLPVRPAWSRTEIAKYLKQQRWIGSRKGTVSQWENSLCYYIKDFRDRIPKNEHGNLKGGYPLSQYQFAVIVKLSYVMTQLQPYVKGSEYLPLIQQVVKNRDIQRRYLSYDAWLYEQNTSTVAS
jgi:hypothetical protein